MKYIITDKNEVRVGVNTFHQILAEGCVGKVIKAGHCSKNKEGVYTVWGESYGYSIQSHPDDAAILTKMNPHIIMPMS